MSDGVVGSYSLWFWATNSWEIGDSSREEVIALFLSDVLLLHVLRFRQLVIIPDSVPQSGVNCIAVGTLRTCLSVQKSPTTNCA